MAKHREELHKKIDNAMKLKEKEIDENKTKHHAILKKQLEEINHLQSLMQERLHTLDDMEDSNEVSPTIITAPKTKSLASFHQKSMY